MTKFTVVNHANESVRVEQSRADAEDRKELGITDLGIAEENIDVVQGRYESYAEWFNQTPTSEDPRNAEADGGPEVVESTASPEPTDGATPEVVGDDLPDDPSVADDPVDWLPSHFIDQIQGVPTVNRKGYAVIASKYGVSVEAEPVTLPSETEFEYAEFRATATTAEGETYSGFGSAHVDRQDGDDPHLLAELAETRAMKRATAWATGVGLTAVEEMKNEL